jgi:proteasome accessory factor C
VSATAAVSRLLVLVPWLLERPGAHVDEAAAAVATDRATVLEDLSLLNFCGLPGRLGGDLFEVELVGDRILLHLAPSFERPLRPSRDEALRLVLSLDHVAAVLGDELPGLDGALDAVRRAAGVPAGVRAAPEPATEHLGPLRTAVTDQRQVELVYRGRADATGRRRRVDPWELLLHRGTWYLHAHDHAAGDLRTFRLDRIEHVTPSDEPVLRPRPAGRLPTPAYQPGPDDVVVELTVAPSGHWVLDLLDGAEVEHGDGATRVTVATDAPRWIGALVLAARGAVVVESPASVRAAVLRAARAGLEAHAANPPLRSGADEQGRDDG